MRWDKIVDVCEMLLVVLELKYSKCPVHEVDSNFRRFDLTLLIEAIIY